MNIVDTIGTKQLLPDNFMLCLCLWFTIYCNYYKIAYMESKIISDTLILKIVELYYNSRTLVLLGCIWHFKPAYSFEMVVCEVQIYIEFRSNTYRATSYFDNFCT